MTLGSGKKTSTSSRPSSQPLGGHGAALAVLACYVLAAGSFLQGFSQVLRVRTPMPMRPRPSLVVLGSLSISASPSTVNFTLAPQSSASGSSAISITTGWSLLTGTTITLNTFGYFSSPTAALTNTDESTYSIPPSSVLGVVGGSGSNVSSYTAFSQATPFSGASGLNLATQTFSTAVATSGNATNTLSLQINLDSQPQLPAGSYTGTLNIVAQAM
jgi:hypothetical protein